MSAFAALCFHLASLWRVEQCGRLFLNEGPQLRGDRTVRPFTTVTLASHGELIAQTIPGARLLTLPAVHLSNVEHPAGFVEAVLGFLE